MVDFDTSSVTDRNIGGISIIIEESEGLEMLSNPINVLPKFNENIIGGDI